MKNQNGSKDKPTLTYPQRQPTDEERTQAANIALVKEEKRRARKKEEKIGNRKGYRDSIKRKYELEKNWLECYENLGMVTDNTLPEPQEEIEEEKIKDPNADKVMMVCPERGDVFWITKEQHQSALFDYTGDINDKNRKVRHPLEWLELKHPDSFKKLEDLVRSRKFSKRRMLKAAEGITRKRFKGVLERSPGKWENNSIVKLERQSDFLKCVNETWRRERLKANHNGETWPPVVESD